MFSDIQTTLLVKRAPCPASGELPGLGDRLSLKCLPLPVPSGPWRKISCPIFQRPQNKQLKLIVAFGCNSGVLENLKKYN